MQFGTIFRLKIGMNEARKYAAWNEIYEKPFEDKHLFSASYKFIPFLPLDNSE